MPITSPVDFISGPSTKSTPSNLLNGNTDSLTLKVFKSFTLKFFRMSFNRSPVITLAAILAMGILLAFATNGTVLLALGFTSKTYTSSFFNAN